MPHILALLPPHYGRDELIGFQGRDAVRAVAYGDLGSGFGSMVMLMSESVASGSDAASALCPDDPSLTDCISGLLIPLPVVPSSHMPGEHNIFAIISLYGGRQAAFRRHLLGAGEAPDGVRDARALVLGMEGVHALVEVVGDDLDAVTARLFELVEHDDVAEIRTFVVDKDSGAGWGQAAELRPSRRQAKSAAAKPRTRRARE